MTNYVWGDFVPLRIVGSIMLQGDFVPLYDQLCFRGILSQYMTNYVASEFCPHILTANYVGEILSQYMTNHVAGGFCPHVLTANYVGRFCPIVRPNMFQGDIVRMHYQ